MLPAINLPIAGAVVAASVRIHQKLGTGLLESVYEVVLARDLVRLVFVFLRQLLRCLTIMDLPPGLVMDVGMATMEAGIRRLLPDTQAAVEPCVPTWSAVPVDQLSRLGQTGSGSGQQPNSQSDHESGKSVLTSHGGNSFAKRNAAGRGHRPAFGL
mgnify:CR=1 FL=1